MLASVGKAEEEAREVLEAVLRSLGFVSVVLAALWIEAGEGAGAGGGEGDRAPRCSLLDPEAEFLRNVAPF